MPTKSSENYFTETFGDWHLSRLSYVLEASMVLDPDALSVRHAIKIQQIHDACSLLHVHFNGTNFILARI